MGATLRSRERWSLGGLAVTGVVLTHWLAYLVAGGKLEAGTSAAVHRYWPAISSLGLGALVVTVGGLVLWYHRDPGVDRGSPVSAAARLAGLQGAGWLGLEAGERAVLGHHLEGFLAEPVVLVGLVVQVAVAVAGTLLMAGLHRAVRALVERTRLASFPRQPLPRPSVGVQLRRLRLAGSGRTLRGPPLR